jgi:hypothetical protein
MLVMSTWYLTRSLQSVRQCLNFISKQIIHMTICIFDKRVTEKNIWHCGVAPAVHRDRLGNWSLALIWLQGPDYSPLIGHNPGLLLASLLDITPWEDAYVLWGYVITPFVGNAVLRRKPQSTFCVGVRPRSYSGIHIWVPSFWTQRTH